MKHKTGLVTVVVPVYNTQKYLDRCINSIVEQTYQNLEILLIDDGSPDQCPQICDDWERRDPRIHVIHKENEGLGKARNTGIENANGEFICFFDSDDYISSETIEKAYRAAIEETADIVVFGHFCVNRQGEIVKESIPTSSEKHYSGGAVHAIFLPDLIDGRHCDAAAHNLCLSAWSCLFSMELIRGSGWLFVSERDIISEDSYSIIWLYKYVKRVAILSEALYFYCENDASLTRTYKKDRYDRIKRFYQECYEMAGQQGYCKEVQRSISGIFLSLSIAAMKQIVAAHMGFNEKIVELEKVINDEVMQQGMKDISCRSYGKARRILFWAMRHKYRCICYMLLAAQNTQKE